jgi:hypothetical protein
MNNFVLVDFENMQPKGMTLLSGGPFRIKVFLGTHQGKIPLDMARALQSFGPDAEYVQIEGQGRNALDFHIAYYVGRLAAENPKAGFYVISKDTGFDPLIRHLKAEGIDCRRVKSIEEIPHGRKTAARPEAGKVTVADVVSNLAKRRSGKPRTLKSLRSAIKASFRDRVSDDDLDGLIAQLEHRRSIRLIDGKVHYEP